MVNRNGDTLILLCCRNGRHEVLKLLLQRVAPSFVAFKADVDGFDAMLACAEADQPHCIETLHAEGIPLDTKTDACNAILPSATPAPRRSVLRQARCSTHHSSPSVQTRTRETSAAEHPCTLQSSRASLLWSASSASTGQTWMRRTMR